MAAHQFFVPNQCSFHGNRLCGSLAAALSGPTRWQINNVASITRPLMSLSVSFIPAHPEIFLSWLLLEKKELVEKKSTRFILSVKMNCV